jgi:hypothetical protein
LLHKVALLASVQAQLLGNIPPPATAPALINAIQLIAYIGLAANVGAALSAMMFLDIMGELPLRLYQKYPSTSMADNPPNIAHGADSTSGLKFISKYGSFGLKFTFYHCFISAILGSHCLLLQVLLLTWVNINRSVTSPAVFALVVMVVVWAMLAFPGYMIYKFFVALKKGFVDARQGN